MDSNGGQTIYRSRTSSGVGPVLTALQAVSHADWLVCWESPETSNTPAPTTGQYQSVKPDALLQFICGDGTIVTLRIPAPDVAIMLADTVTVDPSNVNVVALVAAAVGNLASSSGSLATGYIGGHLDSTRQ